MNRNDGLHDREEASTASLALVVGLLIGVAAAVVLATAPFTALIGKSQQRQNLGTQASKAFNTWVHGIGKLWMPGAEGI